MAVPGGLALIVVEQDLGLVVAQEGDVERVVVAEPVRRGRQHDRRDVRLELAAVERGQLGRHRVHLIPGGWQSGRVEARLLPLRLVVDEHLLVGEQRERVRLAAVGELLERDRHEVARVDPEPVDRRIELLAELRHEVLRREIQVEMRVLVDDVRRELERPLGERHERRDGGGARQRAPLLAGFGSVGDAGRIAGDVDRDAGEVLLGDGRTRRRGRRRRHDDARSRRTRRGAGCRAGARRSARLLAQLLVPPSGPRSARPWRPPSERRSVPGSRSSRCTRRGTRRRLPPGCPGAPDVVTGASLRVVRVSAECQP